MKGKVVLITGASSGIGKALAYEYASHNYNIAISARRENLLKNIAKDLIEKYKVKVYFAKCDVSIEDDTKLFIERAVNKLGKIDVLINNAGISQRSLFRNTDLSVIRKLMEVNYWGTVYTTKYALPYLEKTKGSIIAISSISGYTPLPARTAYASSKYAIHGFLESLRLEYYDKGIHIMVATPSFTKSEIRQNALVEDGSKQGDSPKDEDNLMTAEYVAKKVYKAMQKRKRTVIIPGLKGRLFIKFIQLFPNLSDWFIFTQMKKEKDSPLSKFNL